MAETSDSERNHGELLNTVAFVVSFYLASLGGRYASAYFSAIDSKALLPMIQGALWALALGVTWLWTAMFWERNEVRWSSLAAAWFVSLGTVVVFSAGIVLLVVAFQAASGIEPLPPLDRFGALYGLEGCGPYSVFMAMAVASALCSLAYFVWSTVARGCGRNG